MGETELGKLGDALESHKQSIKSLGDEHTHARQQVVNEQERTQALAMELAASRRELAQEQRANSEGKVSLARLEEMRKEMVTLKDKNEQLRSEFKAAHEETRKATEHYEQALQERSAAEQHLCKERDEKQIEIASLQKQLGQAKAESNDARLEQQRLSRALESAREIADRSQELQKQL